MSEYRYYEVQAIDRPLGEADMEALRILSTRARITATSFTNHYKWGDFQGAPNRLIGRSRRGCDLTEVVELGESLILDCYSARKFDPPESRNLNRLARRSASTLRAE